MPHRRPRGLVTPILIAAMLAACATAPPATPSLDAGSPVASPSVSAAASAEAEASVVPAPGSDSAIYPPNPGAIVVAIDAGHGGCLDWGVPDPSERGEALAEKTLTLAIARELRDRLEAEGVTVVMIRDEDVALAGDRAADFGCDGPEWRDVNGDGEAGFDPEGATRTRDELQARLDVANLVGADALVSIHINSPFDGGQSIEIAFSETFYTDETPWGVDRTEGLARSVQAGVVDELEAMATYDRGDRGVTAHNFYLVAPTLFEPTPERPDPVKQPTRGALMPAVLAEVGSITLRAEHDLLATADGQRAVADGLAAGIGAWFADRSLAARIGLADRPVGAVPAAVPGDGPPFWPETTPGDEVRLRVTNTGTDPMPAGARLVVGWGPTDGPYLPAPPSDTVEVGEPLPALAPGESAVLVVDLPPPPGGGRSVAWISLRSDGTDLADLGLPPLQLSSAAP